jgi:hypothetical protein
MNQPSPVLQFSPHKIKKHFITQYGHNPTNNPKQLKTTSVGVVLLSKEKPHHTTTTVSLQLGQFKAT